MGVKSGLCAPVIALVLAVLITFNSCSSGGNSPPNSPQGASQLGGAIAQLRALDTPPGADEGVFDALKLELESKLSEIWGGAGRIPARAPSGDAGRVTDLAYDSGTGHLTWSYVNLGDYDCNGIVSVPDITPIALNYLEQVNGDPYLQWVDGDGSGAIGVADITPIALNYLSQVAEYLILTCDTAEGEYDEIGRVLFPGAPEFPVTFDVALPPGALEFIAVQPVDGNSNAGERSNPCTLSGNLPPVAYILPSEMTGDAPLTVDFDASNSTDPDGDIVKFEWDFDGDGVWDEDTGTSPYASYVYTAPGVYYAILKVTDDGGLPDTDTATITVTTGGNQPPEADILVTPDHGPAPLEVTLDASNSIDPDGDIVKYEWDFEGDGVWDSDTGGTPTVLHTYTTAGEYYPAVRVTDDGGLTDIDAAYCIVSDNVPPVAEFEYWTTGVAYEIEFDAWESYDEDGVIELYEWDFTDDGTYDFSDAEQYASHNYGSAGTYQCRLRVTDDRGASTDIVKGVYVPPPMLTWEFVKPAGDGDKKNPSLAFIGGNPAISYFDTESDFIMYVSATDGTGEVWDAPNLVEYDVANTTKLFEADGHPAIAYNANASDHLRYIRATNPEGTSWGSFIVLDGAVGAGWFISYADVAGYPALAYYTGSWQAVDFIRATDAEGGNWDTPFRIATDTSQIASLAMISGLPAVSYFDSGLDEKNLMYRRATMEDGTAWDPPVVVADNGDVGSYSSMIMLGSPPGVPAIAYVDSDNRWLMFVRATDSSGSAWEEAEVIDDQCWPHDISLVNIGGVPCVAYTSYTPPANAFAAFKYAADSGGTIWSERHQLSENIVFDMELADIGGYPGIVFYDILEPGLYYIYGQP